MQQAYTAHQETSSSNPNDKAIERFNPQLDIQRIIFLNLSFINAAFDILQKGGLGDIKTGPF